MPFWVHDPMSTCSEVPGSIWQLVTVQVGLPWAQEVCVTCAMCKSKTFATFRGAKPLGGSSHFLLACAAGIHADKVNLRYFRMIGNTIGGTSAAFASNKALDRGGMVLNST